MPCGRTSRTKLRFSTAPFGLPGRLIIKVLSLIPATALESMAFEVKARDICLMASTIPGVCLFITLKVASGVTSLFEKPVPPIC